MKIKLILGLLAALIIAIASPRILGSDYFSPQNKAMLGMDSTALGKYWYEGKAEISRYSLQQNRYRDIHPGHALLVFVTEDFLLEKQVKNDQYRDKNDVPILKLNSIHRFTTGIYDYSIMGSVFAPANLKRYPHALKVTHSSQDWCGQTYMQVNQKKDHLKFQVRSYFEAEADQDLQLPIEWLEDELWTRLRINPKSLPTGKIQVYPSATYLRLMHRELKAYAAEGSLGDYQGQDIPGEKLKVYTLRFPDLERSLEIVYQAKSPYLIEGWTESYPSSFDKKVRRTIAIREKTIKSPYWEHNSVGDDGLRMELMEGH